MHGAHCHLLHHMELFEPNWHTIKLPGMHPLPRNALTKMPETQLSQVNKRSSFSKSRKLCYFSADWFSPTCCSFTNKSLRWTAHWRCLIHDKMCFKVYPHQLGHGDINKTEWKRSDYCHWSTKCEIPRCWSVRCAVAQKLCMVRSFCWRLICHPQLYKFYSVTRQSISCVTSRHYFECIFKRSPPDVFAG